MLKDKENTEKKLTSNLDKFLNKDKNNDCNSGECLVNNPEEIVKREHKKIITNDGRQLLSEYTI